MQQFKAKYGAKLHRRRARRIMTQVYNYFALPPDAAVSFCDAALADEQRIAATYCRRTELDAYSAARSLPALEGGVPRSSYRSFDQYRTSTLPPGRQRYMAHAATIASCRFPGPFGVKLQARISDAEAS